MWSFSGDERLQCPDDYAQRITDAGGLNKFGEPNFRICWGMSEIFRAGGVWEPLDGAYYRGYRDLLLVNEACWALLQWQPAERFGLPGSYYFQNLDEGTGLQTLGEFPFHGRYEIIQPFVHRAVVDGRVVVDAMPLSSLLVDMVIPIIRESKEISALKLREIARERREIEEKRKVDAIEDCIRDASPQWVMRSGPRMACNSVIQKKMEVIENQWKSALKTIRQRGKGLSVGAI
jgi:hypothetical protein